MIQAADEFGKGSHKPALFHLSAFYYKEWTSRDELHVSNVEHGEEKYPTISLFSNKESADKEKYPYNIAPFHFRDASFRLQRMRQIKEVEDESWDAEGASAFRREPPINPSGSDSSSESALCGINMRDVS